MDKIPSFKEFLGQWLIDNTGIKGKPEEAYRDLHMLFNSEPALNYISKASKAYTDLHVQAALKAAAEKAQIKQVKKVDPYDYADESNYGVDEKSILNAYPLNNIV